MKKTRIVNKNQIGEVHKREFDIYREKIRSETKKNKSILYEQWNGYDYYDGQYIKDNLELHYNHKNYPTIDHIISIYKGFINKLTIE